jgi:hypothetical protein
VGREHGVQEADGPSKGSQPVGNYAVLPLRNPAAAHNYAIDRVVLTNVLVPAQPI